MVFTWLRGWGSNPRPKDYICPSVSKRDGLYLHPDCQDVRRFLQIGVLPYGIVSEPYPIIDRILAADYRDHPIDDRRLPAIHLIFIPTLPSEAALSRRESRDDSSHKRVHIFRFRI